MPFKSKSQWRLCWALRRRGQGWDCEEWGHGQRYSKLPERSTKSRSKSRSKKIKSRAKSRSKSKKTKVKSRRSRY
jgi:hypothetical protein